MIKEYKVFFRKYFEIAQFKKKHLVLAIITRLFSIVGTLMMTFFAAKIIEYATEGDFENTFASLGFLVVSYIIYIVFFVLNNKVYGKNMHHSYTGMQTRLLNKLMNVDDNFTKKINRGRLLNSVNNDVLDVGDMCDQISEFFCSIVNVIAALIIVAVYSSPIAILILVQSLVYIYVRNLADRRFAVYLKKQMHHINRYSDLFYQIVSGMQEIKTFDMMSKIKTKLNSIKKDYSKAFRGKMKYITIRDNEVRYITHWFELLLYLIVIFFIMKGNATVGFLVLALGYQYNVLLALDKFISSSTSIRECNVAIDRINDVLNYKSEDAIKFGIHDKDDIEGSVVFDDVSFSANGNEILKNMSFSIKPYSITSIVGRSGSGKTSIINLILRLYKISSGKITIDDVDIYDYTKEIFSTNVAVVNQKPFIFNMSIRRNLNFVDKNINNQIEACKRVGIHDFIMTLPRGYNTVLRENANNISGGQKQLISLARTLLSKSEILLFDDITCSLDPETASDIDKVFDDLKKDHTIIMVTHKPDLMRKSDRIIVLEEGKIVGDGKHKTLIKDNKFYQWLQSRKSPSKIGVFNND